MESLRLNRCFKKLKETLVTTFHPKDLGVVTLSPCYIKLNTKLTPTIAKVK